MRPLRPHVLGACTLLLAAACGRFDYDPLPDAGGAELGGADFGPVDLGPADLGGAEVGVDDDLGAADLGPSDLGAMDLGAVDAGADAGRHDLGLEPMFDGGPDPRECLPPAPACEATCRFDAVAGTTTCGAPTVDMVSLTPGSGTARLSMSDHSALVLTFEICDPTGIVFAVGDSPTNNGYGGDSGTTSHDAELHPVGTTLYLYGNDLGPGMIAQLDGWLPMSGCTTRHLLLRDQRIETCAGAMEAAWSGPNLLRIDPPPATEGVPDAYWYLGLGRTYANAARSGTGLRAVTLCFVR